MCGIAGIIHFKHQPIPDLGNRLAVMNRLIAHRGPDDQGTYLSPNLNVGMTHRRLSIIDLSNAGHQPMVAKSGNVVAHNGEIYNYLELRQELKDYWQFESNSDTETILSSYERHAQCSVDKFRGMFAFALWDPELKQLFCARDRFGIKPFYYLQVGDLLYFASEAKALLPFCPSIETDPEALSEYLAFQYTISDKTLFKGIFELPPGHKLTVKNGAVCVERYWDVRYDINFDHRAEYFERRLVELLDDSVDIHLRSDVPIGAYLSGGIDSSLIALLSAGKSDANRLGFHGRFTEFPGYDESEYAYIAAERGGIDLSVIDISAADFQNHIRDVIYHLDFPVAGPGSFPQYMVSKLAAEKVKVVLGGQGGDEIFGGYARYLVAYFEQCIKAAIDGTYKQGNFVVTIESIVPNLGLLREYKPLIKQFWSEGLFSDLDDRYFRLINRANDMTSEIDWQSLGETRVHEKFKEIFNNQDNVKKEAYFDKMTHFDFKCLLPALLQVEDRMSMAHGLESRVPLLDHELVEFAASIPADVKFEGGQMKRLLKSAYKDLLPERIVNRRDKMGFPVPLKEWFSGDLKSFVSEAFYNIKARQRPYLNADAILENFATAEKFSRKNWGLLSLELWHQSFHDRESEFRQMLTEEKARNQEVISL